MQFIAVLVCIAIAAAEAYGDVSADLGAGVKLPFLGRIRLGVGGGLGFDGGLFGIGKALINRFLSRIGLRPRLYGPDMVGVGCKFVFSIKLLICRYFCFVCRRESSDS